MAESRSKSTIMDKTEIDRALTRISHEIVEKNKGASNLVIVGIRKRGDILAKRIGEKIKKIENIDVPVGAIDITLYRDDYDIRSKRQADTTDLTFPIDKKDVIMVDDVLFAGRTARAGMDVLMEYGRPRTIQLAVLIDRGHRELPIMANFVGKNVPTSVDEEITADIGVDSENVYLAKK